MTTSTIIAFPHAGGKVRRIHQRPAGATDDNVVGLPMRASSGRSHSSEKLQPCDVDLSPSDVWQALRDGRIAVRYQPQYDLRTHTTVAAEALVRIVTADDHLVYPDRFIEMVECHDLVVPFGRLVIDRVCADMAACRAGGVALSRIGINISARQLEVDTGLLGFIDQMVAQHGLNYTDLEFELTERQSLASQSQGIAVMQALSDRGAPIVVDDFGIGCSSVMYLTELPITAFKLDRALVRCLPDDRAARIVVQNLLMLAADLDMRVVAEGIESKRQDETLAQLGCRYGQGYAYGKPMSIEDLQTFITDR